jgi:uncharacterized protein (DUF1501 family)
MSEQGQKKTITIVNAKSKSCDAIVKTLKTLGGNGAGKVNQILVELKKTDKSITKIEEQTQIRVIKGEFFSKTKIGSPKAGQKFRETIKAEAANLFSTLQKGDHLVILADPTFINAYHWGQMTQCNGYKKTRPFTIENNAHIQQSVQLGAAAYTAVGIH